MGAGDEYKGDLTSEQVAAGMIAANHNAARLLGMRKRCSALRAGRQLRRWRSYLSENRRTKTTCSQWQPAVHALAT